jgi:bacterioferritin-associated ferredoxin
MYVCLCEGVTDRAIRAAVDQGACSPEQVAACTGAGTGCGSCHVEVRQIVDEQLGRRRLQMVDEQSAA